VGRAASAANSNCRCRRHLHSTKGPLTERARSADNLLPLLFEGGGNAAERVIELAAEAVNSRDDGD